MNGEREQLIDFKALGHIFEDGHLLPHHKRGGQRAHQRWKRNRAAGR